MAQSKGVPQLLVPPAPLAVSAGTTEEETGTVPVFSAAHLQGTASTSALEPLNAGPGTRFSAPPCSLRTAEI